MSPESSPEYQYQIKHYLWRNFNIDTRGLNFQSDQEAYEYAARYSQERERERNPREYLLSATPSGSSGWVVVDDVSGDELSIKASGSSGYHVIGPDHMIDAVRRLIGITGDISEGLTKLSRSAHSGRHLR